MQPVGLGIGYLVDGELFEPVRKVLFENAIVFPCCFLAAAVFRPVPGLEFGNRGQWKRGISSFGGIVTLGDLIEHVAGNFPGLVQGDYAEVTEFWPALFSCFGAIVEIE